MQSSSGSTKFPHTRAFLTALAREYGLGSKPETTKPPSDTSDSDPDSDSRDGDVAGTDDLAAQVIQLLDDDDEDGVKDLLKRSFDISDESVRVGRLSVTVRHLLTISLIIVEFGTKCARAYA